MTLNTAKRLVLAMVVALSVAGGTLVPLVAGHAAAGGIECIPTPDDRFVCLFM